jgi:hypothetical protein
MWQVSYKLMCTATNQPDFRKGLTGWGIALNGNVKGLYYFNKIQRAGSQPSF